VYDPLAGRIRNTVHVTFNEEVFPAKVYASVDDAELARQDRAQQQKAQQIAEQKLAQQKPAQQHKAQQLWQVAAGESSGHHGVGCSSGCPHGGVEGWQR